MVGRAWPRLDDLAHALRPELRAKVDAVDHIVPQAVGAFDLCENEFLILAVEWTLAPPRSGQRRRQHKERRCDPDGLPKRRHIEK